MSVVEAVKDKVQAAAAGASDLASAAKDTAGEWASAVGDAVVHVKDKVRDVASAAGEKASEMGQDLTALIRRYPVQSLLASLGAGFLVRARTAALVTGGIGATAEGQSSCFLQPHPYNALIEHQRTKPRSARIEFVG